MNGSSASVDIGLALLIGAGVVAFLALVWVVITYNRYARLRQFVRDSWAGIDVELRRRYDLIPNLVQTVKGYAAHERALLERVVELRNRAAAPHARADAQAADENALMLGLKQVFAVSEAYPRLKADANFLALQRELANTEDRIAAARRFFNGNVRDFNQLRQSFPTNIIGSVFGFQREAFFELSSEAERVVPRVG